MPSSIEIHGDLVGPLTERLTRASEDNDYLLAGLAQGLFSSQASAPLLLPAPLSSTDRSFDTDELAAVLRESFHVSSGSAERRAEAFIERMRRIAGANGNESLDSTEEADQLYRLLTSEEGFLLAGGVVVYNDIDAHRETWVRLNCPGTSIGELRSHILPHSPHRYLSDVTVSWSSEVPDGSGDHYLFTFTEVMGRDFPAFTRLSPGGGGGMAVDRWEPVSMSDPDFATLMEGQRANIEAALRDAGEIDEDADPSDVREAVGRIIENFVADRGSVYHASGSHTLNAETEEYVMYQHVDVSSDSVATNAQVYSAAVETALYMCGDGRYRSRPEIPAWVYEPLSYDPARSSILAGVDIERDTTIEPAE